MLRRAFAVTLFLSIPTVGFAQARAAAPSVEGVWKITEMVITGANPMTNRSPQPSLIIFARGHYSYLSVNGTQPRAKYEAPKDPSKLTDAEKIVRYEQWSPFTANAGTYKITGTTLTLRPIVAKVVDVMTTNPPIVDEFKLEGNTLLLSGKSMAGGPAMEMRVKLIRVQ
jgi:hypothetical protein